MTTETPVNPLYVQPLVQPKGRTVTIDALRENISKVDFMVYEDTCLTICIITLMNGYTVLGESACADPAMFNVEIGRKFARENAEKKIWPLMGYALKQELYLAGDDSFQDRVKREYKELTDKVFKLTAFIGGGSQFDELTEEQQKDLDDQLQAMKAYQFILNKRIEAF